MNRKEITTGLSQALERYINPYNDPRIYYAKEITFNYGCGKECRIDYMVFKPINNYKAENIENGKFIAYEIKSSVADFNSGHGCNWYIADKSYLVTTLEVFEQVRDQLPKHVGCIVPTNDLWGSMKVIKNAKSFNREKTTSEMLLMMFRSSNRELYKIRKELKHGRTE
ncbi:MAG: hypothetical protein IJZ79_03715 [Bacilli bacterium]|nr:hypothetical protein [Bacilli bacterium]MBQ8218837.1 hypothetical protein [Bacilli bacterium]